VHSIILTIHNGARKTSNGDVLLDKVISGIINNTVGEYELLCMLDGCTDNSEEIVSRYENDANIKKIILPDVFELLTNNAGFKSSTGEYVIIVQDDQVITEHGWNMRMQKPFEKFNDVFAVTSRCAHNWIPNPNSFYLQNPDAPKKSWCDILDHVDHSSVDHGQSRDVFAVRSTVNRGPLMINLEDLKKLNYLDEDFVPCDMDDHDLMFRAYLKLGKVCGCYWIGVESEPSWSGSLKNLNYEPNHKNTREFYSRYNDILNERRIIDNRELK
jgi:glycosyltransferase involved in cell wall biosynthesis